MTPSSERFPLLLVVTEFPPNAADGGGALARQMLKNYPTDRICWWSCFPERGTTFGQTVNQHFCFQLPARLYPNRRLTGLKAWILSKAWVPLATRHLQKTVAQVRPQQIWAILHGWSIPPLHAAKLVETHRCHVSVWDYQDHNSSRSRFGPSGAETIVEVVESLYRTSATCDAISYPMQEDLAARTGRRDSIVIHSGLEPEQIKSLATPMADDSTEVRIAYAGSIVARKTFATCVRTLQAVRTQLSRPLRLEFFGASSHRAESWFDPGWMYEHGNLDDESFHQTLSRCQWGLVVMDMEDQNPRYNRFSFPNKFGTYLAAGLPLLVMGHRESSAIRQARKYALGFSLDTPDPTELLKSIEEALRTPSPRERFRSAILDCARTEFNADRMRRKLLACFQATNLGT